MTQHLGVPPQPWADFQSRAFHSEGQAAAAPVTRPMVDAMIHAGIHAGDTPRLRKMVALTIALRRLVPRAG